MSCGLRVMKTRIDSSFRSWAWLRETIVRSEGAPLIGWESGELRSNSAGLLVPLTFEKATESTLNEGRMGSITDRWSIKMRP